MKQAVPAPSPSGYTRVAECLYRNDASAIYYALLKKNGKQIRRALKTTDRKLTERKLIDFKEKVDRLDLGQGKNRLTFDEVAIKWLDARRLRDDIAPAVDARAEAQRREARQQDEQQAEFVNHGAHGEHGGEIQRKAAKNAKILSANDAVTAVYFPGPFSRPFVDKTLPCAPFPPSR